MYLEWNPNVSLKHPQSIQTYPQSIIKASLRIPTHPQRILSTSSMHPQRILNTSSTHPQCIPSAFPTHPHCIPTAYPTHTQCTPNVSPKQVLVISFQGHFGCTFSLLTFSSPNQITPVLPPMHCRLRCIARHSVEFRKSTQKDGRATFRKLHAKKQWHRGEVSEKHPFWIRESENKQFLNYLLASNDLKLHSFTSNPFPGPFLKLWDNFDSQSTTFFFSCLGLS